MTDDEADRLAKRIINTFRLTAALPEWIDVLRTCEPGAAGTAFVRLRNEVDGGLTIARFMREYRAVTAELHDPSSTPPVHCQLCDGAGWTDADPWHGYRQVQPCRCHPAGTQARRVYDSINNERRATAMARTKGTPS